VSKSEKTKAFIIETVAPIFNRNGYAAMSLSKITEATGLTKGAIYGHFKNKEELAVEAFVFSVRRVLRDLNAHINQGNTPIAQLLNVATFYQNYFEYNKAFGGCPILNIGVDSNNQNTLVIAKVRSYNTRILKQFTTLIEHCKEAKEIKSSIKSELYAKRFFSMIEGAVYMSYIMDDKEYMKDLAIHMKEIINRELI
jgi:AcrR family transcriptional regulator